MLTFKFHEIILVAKKGTAQQWENVLKYLESYSGDEDDIIGVKLFVKNNAPNERAALLKFAKELNNLNPNQSRSLKLIRMPNWVMVAAASLLLISGLAINHYFHQKTLHIVEDAMPIFLSNNDAVMNKAMAQYKKGDYLSAVKNFEKLQSDTAAYYAGVCYELGEDFDNSIVKFNEIYENSDFFVKARIRLAAIYIAQNKNEQAKNVIHNITPTNENEAERLKSIKIRLY